MSGILTLCDQLLDLGDEILHPRPHDFRGRTTGPHDQGGLREIVRPLAADVGHEDSPAIVDPFIDKGDVWAGRPSKRDTVVDLRLDEAGERERGRVFRRKLVRLLRRRGHEKEDLGRCPVDPGSPPDDQTRDERDQEADSHHRPSSPHGVQKVADRHLSPSSTAVSLVTPLQDMHPGYDGASIERRGHYECRWGISVAYCDVGGCS